MDDLIIIGSHKAGIKWIKTKLGNKFKISDLGVLKYFLGIKAFYIVNGVTYLAQKNILIHQSTPKIWYEWMKASHSHKLWFQTHNAMCK